MIILKIFAVNMLYQNNFKSVNCFNEKVLSVKKYLQAKINQQIKIKQTLNNKATFFMRAKLESG